MVISSHFLHLCLSSLVPLDSRTSSGRISLKETSPLRFEADPELTSEAAEDPETSLKILSARGRGKPEPRTSEMNTDLGTDPETEPGRRRNASWSRRLSDSDTEME